ncbi:MAG: tyrosine-type recombinase/integrase [Acidimicrobiales bacterium]
MSDLRQSLGDYLTIRRSLGFKLVRTGLLLADFVDYAEHGGAEIITTELAFSWATLPPDGAAAWWAQRLGVVRGFARHLHAIDPAHEVPPTDLIVGRSRRATPYPYSAADIEALMTAAGSFRSPLRVCTFETLVGLLATTGMRVGEAIGLDRSDIDWDNGLVLITDTKFGKSRLVPLHPTTVDALAAYNRRRDQLCARPRDPSFFVSTAGTRLHYCNVHEAWLQLVRRAGLERISARCRPRPHDLRHRFAVNTLIGWYRDGVEVQARLPLLSTYLGHTNPGSTYWYLSAAPELLSLTARRLDAAQGAKP